MLTEKQNKTNKKHEIHNMKKSLKNTKKNCCNSDKRLKGRRKWKIMACKDGLHHHSEVSMVPNAINKEALFDSQ